MLCEEAAKVQKQVIMDRVQERHPSLDWVQYKQWNCSNATFTDSILAELTPNLKSTKSQKQVTGSGLEDSGLAIAVIPHSQIPVSAFCTNTHINKQPTTDTAKDGGKPQHKKGLNIQTQPVLLESMTASQGCLHSLLVEFGSRPKGRIHNHT